ncbi:MAG: phage tail protein [Chloroflexota bacterium]
MSMEPATSFRFYIHLSGFAVAEFTKCGGLTLEREVETVEEGGLNNRVHILPGRSKYTNVTLSHGVTYSTKLWDWYEEGLYNGKVSKQSLTITLGDVEGKVIRRWHVENAFPVKFDGPELDGESSTVAIETLELAHERLWLDSVGLGSAMS